MRALTVLRITADLETGSRLCNEVLKLTGVIPRG
jgi:hypothetical protein